MGRVVDLERRSRGAFFTPPEIARYLVEFGVPNAAAARVLDPTCGEAVILAAAVDRMKSLGHPPQLLRDQICGVDIHAPSVERAKAILRDSGIRQPAVFEGDFLDQTPQKLGLFDAVIGNPPFVRYQELSADARRRAAESSLAHGVRLSGSASLWAHTLVHAASFVKPSGRLAMVLPAELLSVEYAEPVRRWLRRRFASVSLVMFESLPFPGVQERVLLLLAHGTGGCDSFRLVHVADAAELAELHFGHGSDAVIQEDGSWTRLFLPSSARRVFEEVAGAGFSPLSRYGRVELGTVTGNNKFFTLTDHDRLRLGLSDADVTPIVPPRSGAFQRLSYGVEEWESAKAAGRRVWLFRPRGDSVSDAARDYVELGVIKGANTSFKCASRGEDWWLAPNPVLPDMFVTYLSHHGPRVVRNGAGVACLNTVHGFHLASGSRRFASALPMLLLNSVSLLAAELDGRAFAGGLLKLEPTQAAALLAPKKTVLTAAWRALGSERDAVVELIAGGRWEAATRVVDSVLLGDVLGVDREAIVVVQEALNLFRSRRLSRRAGQLSPVT